MLWVSLLKFLTWLDAAFGGGEIGVKIEQYLVDWSGAQGDIFKDKSRRLESHDTVPERLPHYILTWYWTRAVLCPRGILLLLFRGRIRVDFSSILAALSLCYDWCRNITTMWPVQCHNVTTVPSSWAHMENCAVISDQDLGLCCDLGHMTCHTLCTVQLMRKECACSFIQ
jgi:hypothetical protein